ncbi:MAG: FISUMP domain-containing protein, partial [Alistipes sp.]
MKTTFMHIGIAFVFFMLCASCSDDKELTPEIPKQPLAGTMTDLRDNNTYATITLGVQTWLAENLRYLPQIDNTTSSKEGRYYILYFTGTDVVEAREDKFYKAYGVYYNLPAALHGAAATTGAEQTPVQGICPEGWHLPTTREWRMLSEYVVS